MFSKNKKTAPAIKNKKEDELVRNRRLMLLGVAIAVTVVIISVFVYKAKKHRHKAKPKATIEVAIPKTDILKQEWLIKSQAQLEKTSQEVQKINSELKRLKLENEHLKEALYNNKKASFASTETPPVNYPPPPVSLPSIPEKNWGKKPNYPKPNYKTEIARSFTPNNNQTKQKPNVATATISERQMNNLIAVATPTGAYKPNNKTNKPNVGVLFNQTLNQTPSKPNLPRKHFLIPPGSFVSAMLLTGADVPTMGNGAVGPIPVVFRVMSMAQMPNYFKANIKSCFLLGEATGSLSAERAYIRVSKLSCVKKDGTPLVISVRGYATGADGKVGLKGRVVSKQGAVLARALVAGFLQGVGQAFSRSQTNISISPLGSTSSVGAGTATVFKYGLGEGVGKATEMLAKFYMKMATQMFPVIEINAGRVADIIFLNGVNLTGGAK